MKNIVILATGGTIASRLNPENGLYLAGAMKAEELVSPALFPELALRFETFSHEASSAMTMAALAKLSARIRELFADKSVSGIVVTHGTDTLEETAYFLSLCNADERPVIITGAQRTLFDEGSDALCNLRDAICAAASPACAGLGAAIVFNECILSARYARKAHSSHTDAFTAFGFGMLGSVDKGEVHMAQRPVGREHYLPISPMPRVDIVKAYLGSDGTFIDAAVAAKAEGIILEGFGRGHVPAVAAEAVSRAVQSGVHIIVTTTCENGRVHPVYDFTGSLDDLVRRGAIPGADYASRKARIKLALLLASGTRSRQAVLEAFSR